MLKTSSRPANVCWAVSTQIWDFPNISLFPKILSLKSIANFWVKFYTKFSVNKTDLFETFLQYLTGT